MAGFASLYPPYKPIEKPRFRVEVAAQPGGRRQRETQRQGAAPGRRQRACDTVAQHRRAEGIRHYQATFFGDQKSRKFVRHSEIEPVRELPVAGPFAVGAEIGHRALDLDDDEVARLAERQHVGAAAIGQREFDKARIAELRQRPADAARQQQGRTRAVRRRSWAALEPENRAPI